jgi:hypothetical protein
MITFRRLSHRSSYNKKSSINSVSNVRSSFGRFVSRGCMSTSGYRLYSRCRGRSSSNKNKSKSKSGGRRRRSSSRILITGIIVAGTVAGSLDRRVVGAVGVVGQW